MGEPEPAARAAEREVSAQRPGLVAFVRALWARSAVRYLVVGASLFVIGFAVTLSLAALGVDVRLAEGVSRVAGATLGFFGHKHVTFPLERHQQALSTTSQGVSYLVVAVVNVLVAPWVLWTAHRLLGWLPLAKVVSDGIMVLETFFLLRLVFSDKKKAL